MTVSRRLFLQSISAISFCPANLWAGKKTDDIFISGTKQNSVYNISAFNSKGKKQYNISMPNRAHDIALDPVGNNATIFARRPDTFAIVFDSHNGRVIKTISSDKHRHFYGHGVYSSTGNLLLSTEKNLSTGAGIIGIRDARDNYKMLAEIDSYGIGPHQMVLMADNRTLVVAVGGIQTAGRERLNVDTMQPSLNYIDLYSGKLLGKYTLPNSQHKLSIRHIDVAKNGTVVFACQDKDKLGNLYSLTGFHNGKNILQTANTDNNILKQQHKYCGSVAMEVSEKFVAVSSPRGNMITIWNIQQELVIDTLEFNDSCGVSSTKNAGEFLFTSGSDGCMFYNIANKQKTFVDTPFILNKSWDNHATTMAR